VTYTSEINVTFDEGVNILVVYANDSVGNLNSTNVNFIVDTTAPLIEFVAPTTAGNQSQDYIIANVSVSDLNLDTTIIYLYDSSGLVNSSIGAFVNFTGLVDGTYYLNATANDTFGDINVTETRTIILDTTSPLIEFVEPTTNTTNCSLGWIVGNVSASDDNLDSVVIYLYNSSGLVNSSIGTFVNFTISLEDTYYLNASVNDTAGNENSTKTRTIVLDTTAPLIDIVSPLNQSYTNTKIVVNFSSDGDNIWYNWNGTNVAYTSTVNVTFDEGVNTLYVYANDSCGNTNSSNVSFTVDSVAPLIDIYSPLNQSYNNATILINISSDGDNIWYNWNGTNVAYISAVNVTFDGGVNTLVAYANDSIGNIGNSSVTFIVDLEGPTVSLISPINGSTVTSSLTVNFEYNVTDASTVENCSLIINDVFNSVETGVTRNVTQSISAVLSNGDYNWSINCTDEVNNKNSSMIENFTLNYVAPVTPPAPSGGGGGGSSGCFKDSDCDEERYCLNYKCYDYECNTDSDCNDTKTCWMHRCVKLFDMKIIDVESPIIPGESFEFTYFLKGVAEIHGDVIVKFWLENAEGEIATEGFDTIYMADFEEKMETSELFLPATIAPGTYNFYAEVNYDSYYARALRVIDVEGVPSEMDEAGFLTGRAVLDIRKVLKTNIYFILVIVGILILFLIVYWERREIRNALIPESRWIKRHKISIGAFLFLVALAGISFYADKAEIIKLSPFKMSFVKYLYIMGLVTVIIIIFSRVRIRNLFGYFWRFVKSLFSRKQGLRIKRRVKRRVKIKPVKKFKFSKIKPKTIPIKRKVKAIKIKPKVVEKSVAHRKKKVAHRKKQIFHRIKKKKHVAGLLERSHPKLYRELKKPTAKLSPTKIKVVKESSGKDRELERARAMREKLSSIAGKHKVSNSHPNLKKDIQKIKSEISRAK